jgi:uncharacterized NAD-dependent epimerase/dehydratase family protein
LDWNCNCVKDAVVIARGLFCSGSAKTAHGLILHGKKFRIVAVIDETCAGHDAGELMGIGHRGIPVVASLDEIPGTGYRVPGPGSRTKAAGSHRRPSSFPGTRYPEPCTLIIGVAPPGGRLPKKWRRDVKDAMKRGMDIVSGLHDLLGDDPMLASLATKMGVKIWDVRRPPEKLELFKGHRWPVPVVLTCGTDASSGKRTVTAELHRAARARGIDAAIVATGQTGIMVGADAGTAIDRVPGDFLSGTVEDMVQRTVQKGAELVFVQGQASITHPAYGPVTLGILFGARPHYVVMVHVPGRVFRPSFPDQPVSPPMEEYALVRILSGAEAVGIALNCQKCPDPAAVVREYEISTGLPAADVLREGPGKILDSLLIHLAGDRRFHYGPGLRKALRGPRKAGAKGPAGKRRVRSP